MNPPSPIHAVISSKEALQSLTPRIIEHGLVPGNFIVKITVTSEKANCHECFEIHIDREANKLTMKKFLGSKNVRLAIRVKGI